MRGLTLLLVPFLIVAIVLALLAIIRTSVNFSLHIELSRFSTKLVSNETNSIPLQDTSFIQVKGADVLGIICNDNKCKQLKKTKIVLSDNNYFELISNKQVTLFSLGDLKYKNGERLVIDTIRDQPSRIRLDLKASSASLLVSIPKKIRLYCSTCQIEGHTKKSHNKKIILTAPQELEFDANNGSTALVLHTIKGEKTLLSMFPKLPEQTLTFDRLLGRDVVSTIIEGKLQIDSMKETIQLSHGDILSLDLKEGATLSEVKLINGSLIVKLNGVAKSIRRLEGDESKEKVPTILEQIINSTFLSSVASIFLLLSLTLLGLFTRLKIVPKE